MTTAWTPLLCPAYSSPLSGQQLHATRYPQSPMSPSCKRKCRPTGCNQRTRRSNQLLRRVHLLRRVERTVSPSLKKRRTSRRTPTESLIMKVMERSGCASRGGEESSPHEGGCFTQRTGSQFELIHTFSFTTFQYKPIEFPVSLLIANELDILTEPQKEA